VSDQLTIVTDEPVIAKVKLEIPCLAEYVGVARLAILGVANRIAFTYDEVEDVRLAVGEACTHAIERAADRKTYLAAHGQESQEPCTLTIACTIDKSTLSIELTDTIPVAEHVDTEPPAAEDGIDYQKLGTVLMEILVDQVTFETSSSGTTVRLVKTASQAN